MIGVSTTPTVHRPAAPGEQADGPLSEEHLRELTEANERAQKVLRAGRMATFNGWAAAILAAVSLPFILSGPTAAVMAVGLAVVARNEFRGRTLIREFDVRGPRLLGWNQLAFMALLIGYGLWNIHVCLAGPKPYEEEIRRMPELKSMLAPISDLQTTVALALYGGVILGTIVFQGLTALYYFTRTGYLRAYLDQTTPWVIDVQRRSGVF